MPKWTPELDSILLHAIFEECNISFSKALCNKISDHVKATGTDCTPKAVENRLYSWKKKNLAAHAAATNDSTNGDGDTQSTASTPAKKNTPVKTPRARKTPGSKKVAEDAPGDEEPMTPTPNRKRAADSEDSDTGCKKIKTEHFDEAYDLVTLTAEEEAALSELV